MKLAVPAQGGTFDSPVDLRFGRCAHFVIVDTDTWDFVSVPNPAAVAPSGAGVRAAEYLVSLGIEAVIATEIGSNAARVFDAADVKVYPASGNTVREAVKAILHGSISTQIGKIGNEAETSIPGDKKTPRRSESAG